MRRKFNHWIFKFFPKRTIAIITPWCIYFRDKNPADHVIRHELIHARQIKKHGVIGFYFIYVKDYLFNMIRFKFDHYKSYYAIPFEIEAYQKEFDSSIIIDQR